MQPSRSRHTAKTFGDGLDARTLSGLSCERVAVHLKCKSKRLSAARCPGDLAGLRDRALLLLTACGLGGERLLALDCEHVRVTGHEMTLLVPGPQDGAGEVVVLARMASSAVCPVRALEGWLHSSDTRFGPVFRKVDRWGGVEHSRLRPDALRRIWQRRAKAVRVPRAAAEAAG